MKGFKKDGKFRPTGNKSKSSLKKSDIRNKKSVEKKSEPLKEKNEKGIGDLSGKTRMLAENEVGAKIEKHPYGNSYEFENGEEWLIFNNEKDAHKEALEYMENLFDDIGVDGWNKDFVQDYMEMSYTDINIWASEDGDRFVEDRDLEELIDMNDSWKFGITEPKEESDGEVSNLAVEQFSEKIAEKRSDYVRDLLTHKGLEYYIVDEEGLTNEEDFWKEYGEKWLHVDKDKMFEASIDADGIGNTLSSYDGKEIELDNGTLMYRHN